MVVEEEKIGSHSVTWYPAGAALSASRREAWSLEVLQDQC